MVGANMGQIQMFWKIAYLIFSKTVGTNSHVFVGAKSCKSGGTKQVPQKYKVESSLEIDFIFHEKWTSTGKSFSEALILASVNPQFIEFPEKYKFRTCCVQKCVFFLFLLCHSKQYLYTTCLIFIRNNL